MLVGIFFQMVHIPVLLKETLEILSIKPREKVLDCTFGGGGHTKAILNSSDNCYVYAIDRDPEAEDRAKAIKQKYGNRFDFVQSKFSDISNLFNQKQKFDAVLFDFGVSSFQLDDAERGFSFLKEALLDMRMSKRGLSAYDVVNTFSDKDLSDIIWTYGDERHSRKIASQIVKDRTAAPIKTTTRLANIIHQAIGFSVSTKKYSKVDSATKTFQAIRIFINDELREISVALENLPKILKNGARIALISFHALEDRIVKNWATSRKNCIIPMNKAVIKPTLEEIRSNPRSRSAVLRGFWYNECGDERSGAGIE